MKDLKRYNTFGLSAKSDKFIEIKSLEEAMSFFSNPKEDPILILGGGSNILLTNDFKGIVVYNDIKGIELIEDGEKEVLLKVMAGENWHEFVMHCIEKDYSGIENLSLIPGKVGASPMQNIGAYGVEVKDVIEEVEAVSVEDGSLRVFKNEECQFDYRSSIFKTSEKGKYFITSVSFRLKKEAEFKTSYGAIQDELSRMGIDKDKLSIREVSNAVISIRQSKLPDPAEIGNSGSFFKNPIVSRSDYDRIMASYPDVAAYDVGNNNYKIAAGWMIEKAGWKGYREGDFGVHAKQALVLVNYGNASGKEIYDLSEKIIKSIEDKFGVRLEREVNII